MLSAKFNKINRDNILEALIFAIIMVPLLTSQNIAYAEPLKASIWTPSKLLLGQQYYGVIILEQDPGSDITFDLVTDNDEVVHPVEDSITIQKGKHHGVFTLDTKGTGSAKIYAIHKDTLLEYNLDVVESASTPTKVDIITPISITDVMSGKNIRYTGYVFLLNDFDNPVVSKEPTAVTLTSNGDVILSRNLLTINPGSHYAKFSFESKGAGSITATAQNLEPDQATVSVTDPNEIELHLEAAPNPIPTSSSAEIYYWLERDGKPYIPQHDVKITITIDKSSNLSFDSVIKGAIVLSSSTIDRQATDSDAGSIVTRTDAQLKRDSTREIVLQKGTHYGRITAYSSFDSAGDISISGMAQSVNPAKDEETIRITETVTVGTEKTNSDGPTETQVFALPDPAYDKVEIIVSSHSDNGPALEQTDETFTVFVDNKLSLSSTTGKIRADENYAIVVAEVQDIGSSTIFAQRNEIAGEEVEVEIQTKYVRNPDIGIVSLPIIFGVTQDLFLISSSHDQIFTNPNSTNKGNLISITSRPIFDYQVINDNTSVITVRGAITNLLEEDPVIHVASNAFTATETLDVYNPNRNKIESMHPKTVYAGELFPIINHVTDLEGNPMRIAELKISSGVEMATSGNLAYLNQSGTHGVIFYDKNTVPIETTITVAGAAPSSTPEQQAQQQIQVAVPTITTYEITVVNGEGSGRYAEGTNVTISAPPTIDDMFVIKKKLVGWENLPYAESTVSFEADFDVETKPIYQQDFTMLVLIGVGAAGAGGVIVFKKKIKRVKKDDHSLSDEEKMIDELLEK